MSFGMETGNPFQWGRALIFWKRHNFIICIVTLTPLDNAISQAHQRELITLTSLSNKRNSRLASGYEIAMRLNIGGELN